MDIDQKLKLFEESCERLAKIEADKLNQKINTEIEEQIESEIEEYIKKQELSYKKQCEKIEKEYNKSLYECEIKCKKSIQNVKDIINRELKEEAERYLNNFTQESQEYLNYLTKNINDCLKNVDDTKNMTIYVTQRDYLKYKSILDNYNLPIKELDNSFIGGSKLVSESQGIAIDNTIKSNLDKYLNGR